VKRTTVSLIGAAATLVVVAGIASATAPGGGHDGASATAARMPVQRTTVTCPAPSQSEFADTTYTAFSPGGGTGTGGKATLLPAPSAEIGGTPGTGSGSGNGGKDGKGAKGAKKGAQGGTAAAKPVAPLTTAGKPVSAGNQTDNAPALIGTADGALAPGYTVQQTTKISAGDGRGLAGTSCTVPGAEFWLPGASTAKSRQDYVHLTNPDDTPAVVDVELYGKDGQIDVPDGNGVNVPGHGSVPLRLSTLTSRVEGDLTVHVVSRSGRVGAELQAVDSAVGGDWLPPSAGPADSLVLPALPKDVTAAHLVLFAPGADDADLKVRLTTPTGAISPAGHETIHVKNQMTTTADLGAITDGEAGALLLTPTDPKHAAPVVAALEVTRGKGAARETAFVPATAATGPQATVSGNTASGTTLYLTAPGRAATVRVISSAATGGGQPASTTVQVKPGTTLALTPPKPSGKGTYALSVRPVSGGPVYAARMLATTSQGVPMFTIQPMPDDHAKVTVPTSEENVSILNG
jgi:Family of unknown function (DUF5719)